MAATHVQAVGAPPSFFLDEELVPLWLRWVVLGLISGALAKFMVSGRDPPGCLVTVLLGIVGALVGGWIGTALGWGSVSGEQLDLRSIGLATAGAVAVLVAARVVLRRRR